MRYATVCSGVEAMSLGVHAAGIDSTWTPVFFSEIEPFPCAVLAHHFPNVPNLGDMTKIDGKVEQIKTNTFKSENNLRKAECCMTCNRVTFTHCGDVVICDLRPDMDIEKSSVCNKYQHL